MANDAKGLKAKARNYVLNSTDRLIVYSQTSKKNGIKNIFQVLKLKFVQIYKTLKLFSHTELILIPIFPNIKKI